MFRKSLFRIENNKKYSYTKKYVMYHERKDDSLKKIREDDYNKLVKFWEQKAKDEKEDNIIEYKKTEGQSIIYGQAIQLKHLYSDCYLTLKSEDLARQNGCVEVIIFHNLFYSFLSILLNKINKINIISLNLFFHYLY